MAGGGGKGLGYSWVELAGMRDQQLCEIQRAREKRSKEWNRILVCASICFIQSSQQPSSPHQRQEPCKIAAGGRLKPGWLISYRDPTLFRLLLLSLPPGSSVLCLPQ